MSTITYGREAAPAQGLRFVPRLLSKVSARVADYLARSRAERQLKQLDDRLLLDIGLKRSDIGPTVWGR